MLTLYIADVERDVGMKKLSQEEAVKVLEDMKVKIEIPKAAVTQWKRNTALDMAIKALEQPEQRSFSCGQENDTISRQAALEIMAKWLNDVCGMREIEGVKLTPLKQLHAAQPVLTCKGCKYDYYEYAQCRNCLRKERDLYEPE